MGQTLFSAAIGIFAVLVLVLGAVTWRRRRATPGLGFWCAFCLVVLPPEATSA